MKLKENGIYLLNDEFFKKYDNNTLMDNKNSSRPHYYVCKDKYNNDIFWVIPLTSKIENVRKKIEKYELLGKENPFYILDKNYKKSAFNVGGSFPITQKYILREFKRNGKHVIIKNKELLEKINKKFNYIKNKNMKYNEFIKNIYDKLNIELKLEKNVENKIYNPLTGNELKVKPEYKIPNYNSNQWLTKEDTKKHNLPIKNGTSTTIPLIIEKNGKPIIKEIEFYNVDQLEISQNFKKNYFLEINTAPKIEKKIEKNQEKSKGIEISR